MLVYFVTRTKHFVTGPVLQRLQIVILSLQGGGQRHRIIGIVGRMGFVRSYLQLPRYQRILIGCIGIAVGWYGPTVMSYLFLEVPASKSTTNNKID